MDGITIEKGKLAHPIFFHSRNEDSFRLYRTSSSMIENIIEHTFHLFIILHFLFLWCPHKVETIENDWVTRGAIYWLANRIFHRSDLPSSLHSRNSNSLESVHSLVFSSISFLIQNDGGWEGGRGWGERSWLRYEERISQIPFFLVIFSDISWLFFSLFDRKRESFNVTDGWNLIRSLFYPLIAQKTSRKSVFMPISCLIPTTK